MKASDDKIVYRQAIGAIKGAAFGLSQPSIQVKISTGKVSAQELALTHRYLNSIIGTPIFYQPVHTGDGSPLITSIFDAYKTLSLSVNIPIFDNFVLEQLSAPRDVAMADWIVTIPAVSPPVADTCLRWLIKRINDHLQNPEQRHTNDTPIEQDLEELKSILRQDAVGGTNMIRFLRSIYRANLPYYDIGAGIYSIGVGQNSRWIHSTITDETSMLGCKIARDKQLSAELLRKFALPVPEHFAVATEDEAIKYAAILGYPVVVKPVDQDQGLGVYAGLKDEASVREYFKIAKSFSKRVLIERHYYGDDYRITVMHDQVIQVMHRKPAQAVGDGKSTVATLIKNLQASTNIQRAFKRTGKLRLEIDNEVLDLLREQNVKLEDVLDAGKTILLRRKSNISVGGTHELISPDKIHPENIHLAIRIARLLGLDFAGIDLITPDIRVPWHENNAIVCEVNAQPQLGFEESPRLYDHIIAGLVGTEAAPAIYLLPEEQIDESSNTTIQSVLQQLNCNAYSNSRGAWIDGEQVAWAPKSSFDSARVLLLDRKTTSALILMKSQDILSYGFPVADFTAIDISRPTYSGDRNRKIEDLEASANSFILNHLKNRRLVIERLKIERRAEAVSR